MRFKKMADNQLQHKPNATDMADTRTAWAEDRTMLANERTFASWIRTGMAAIALALGLKVVFKDTEHTLIAKGAAEIFIFVAILIFWMAVIKSHKAQKRMKTHDVEAQSSRRMILLASLLTFAAAVTGILLWLL